MSLIRNSLTDCAALLILVLTIGSSTLLGLTLVVELPPKLFYNIELVFLGVEHPMIGFLIYGFTISGIMLVPFLIGAVLLLGLFVTTCDTPSEDVLDL